MAYRKDLTNQKFSMLTAIEWSHKVSTRNRWLCKCDCGSTCYVDVSHLTRGSIRSCGCYRGIKAKNRSNAHGYSRKKLYSIWNSMRMRCKSKNDKAYRWYGERGIDVHKDWDSFVNFKNWALSNGYKEGLSIERINNDGNYCPGNCKWISRSEQCRNRRNNVIFRGETATEASARLGGSHSLVHGRIAMGWSKAKAFSVPSGKI